jgi:hypothetical protein
VSNCDVCDEEPSVGVASVPGMPVSVAYGKTCLQANAHPWELLVANTALCGGFDQTAEWWQEMVMATCSRLGRSLAEFEADVRAEIAEEDRRLSEWREADEDGA